MAERDVTVEAIAELPVPGETEPTRWPEDGATAAVVSSEHKSCECPEKQTTFRFTSLPCLYLTSPLHAHPTILIFDHPMTVLLFLQNWVYRLLSSATRHLGRRLGTFRCTQPTERARNFAPWYSGKMHRSGNGQSPGRR